MGFFNVATDVQSVQDSSGGKYINESGIYPVTLKIVSVKTNEKNARSLDFNVDYEGSSNMLYGLRLDNNDGSKNFQANTFTKLCHVAGIEGSVSDPEVQTHKVGKDQTERDLLVLTDFDDLEVKVRVQMIYSRYNGEIREAKEIKNFYRGSDNATAAEILAGTEAGVQYGKDEAYADSVSYKDGVTADEVVAWKAAKRGGNSAPTSGGQTPATNSFAGGSGGFPG